MNDPRRLVLFDIDGTILWTNGAGRAAIRQALLAEFGTAGPIDGYRFDGKTDLQIVRELMLAANHPSAESEPHMRAVCDRYLGLLERELERRSLAVRVFEGVLELMDDLESREGTVLGLVTGNLETGASLKLEAAGIAATRFRVGGFGSDAADRAKLPPIAVRRTRELIDWEPVGEEVVVLGDTPADMQCGQPIGARAIGVATGSYSVDDLEAAGAHAAFESLADRRAVVSAIYA